MAFTKVAGVEYGVPEVSLSTSAAEGSNQTAIRTDAQLIAFSTANPESIAYGQSAGTGSSAVASRLDHDHGMAAADNVSAATQAEQEAGSSATVFTSPGRQQFHASAAKAWCYINTDGTLRAGNYGVSSVTDTATGSRTINFSTAFGSADTYAVAHCLNNALGYIQVSSYNTGAQAFLVKNSSGTNTDYITQHVYYGEQV